MGRKLGRILVCYKVFGIPLYLLLTINMASVLIDLDHIIWGTREWHIQVYMLSIIYIILFLVLSLSRRLS